MSAGSEPGKPPECDCTAEAEWQARKAKEEAERPFVTILSPGGTLHSPECAITKSLRLSPEVERELYETFREYDRARNRAWAEAQHYVIG